MPALTPSCPPSRRHARPWGGHPRLAGRRCEREGKTWMAGPGPAMTRNRRSRRGVHEEAFTKRRSRRGVAAALRFGLPHPPLRCARSILARVLRGRETTQPRVPPSRRPAHPFTVMPALTPSCPPLGRASTTCGTLARAQAKSWMAGTSPAMTLGMRLLSCRKGPRQLTPSTRQSDAHHSPAMGRPGAGRR
jgi:hypothetical protein